MQLAAPLGVSVEAYVEPAELSSVDLPCTVVSGLQRTLIHFDLLYFCFEFCLKNEHFLGNNELSPNIFSRGLIYIWRCWCRLVREVERFVGPRGGARRDFKTSLLEAECIGLLWKKSTGASILFSLCCQYTLFIARFPCAGITCMFAIRVMSRRRSCGLMVLMEIEWFLCVL